MKATRRSFIAGGFGLAVLGGTMPAVFAPTARAAALPAVGDSIDPDNVLLVVQMGGGNDGLNTVVPYSDDAYYRARPGIGIPATAVLKIDDRIGVHPALAPLLELYKEGRVALVQGVGYPNPDRSHFRATEIWETAAPDRPVQTGWLGRYLDRSTPAATRPANLFKAVALGDSLPTALVSQHTDVAAIGALAAFQFNTGKDIVTKTTAGALFDGARSGQSPYLALIQETSRSAFHGGDALRAKIGAYKQAATYPANPFANQLALAAQIIGSNTGTKIIFVSIGSFDTHAGQRNQQDRLLGYLASGLAAFYADLSAHNLAGKVLTMTFSEFGRRVAQNASAGTDHGTAMPLFIIGGGTKGGIYGQHPSLTDLDRGDLKYSIDFRSVYATVLERWLGRSPGDVIQGEFGRVAFV